MFRSTFLHFLASQKPAPDFTGRGILFKAASVHMAAQPRLSLSADNKVDEDTLRAVTSLPSTSLCRRSSALDADELARLWLRQDWRLMNNSATLLCADTGRKVTLSDTRARAVYQCFARSSLKFTIEMLQERVNPRFQGEVEIALGAWWSTATNSTSDTPSSSESSRRPARRSWHVELLSPCNYAKKLGRNDYAQVLKRNKTMTPDAEYDEGAASKAAADEAMSDCRGMDYLDQLQLVMGSLSSLIGGATKYQPRNMAISSSNCWATWQ